MKYLLLTIFISLSSFATDVPVLHCESGVGEYILMYPSVTGSAYLMHIESDAAGGCVEAACKYSGWNGTFSKVANEVSFFHEDKHVSMVLKGNIKKNEFSMAIDFGEGNIVEEKLKCQPLNEWKDSQWDAG